MAKQPPSKSLNVRVDNKAAFSEIPINREYSEDEVKALRLDTPGDKVYFVCKRLEKFVGRNGQPAMYVVGWNGTELVKLSANSDLRQVEWKPEGFYAIQFIGYTTMTRGNKKNYRVMLAKSGTPTDADLIHFNEGAVSKASVESGITDDDIPF